MENIIIRKITPKDVDVLHMIETQCFTDPWSKRNFEILPELSYAHFYILEYENVPVGFGGIYVFDIAELTNIAVLPRFRKMHFGKMLLEHCIKESQRLGAEKILLEVRQRNTPALMMYAKAGFKVIGDRKNYYKAPVECAIIMAKEFKNENTFI